MRSKDQCGAGQGENCCYLCPSVDSRGKSSLFSDCGCAGPTCLWFRRVLLLVFACQWFRGANSSAVLRGPILTICLSVATWCSPVCGFVGCDSLPFACLWVRGVHQSVVSRGAILYYLPVSGFTGLIRLWFRGVLYFTIFQSVGS